MTALEELEALFVTNPNVPQTTEEDRRLALNTWVARWVARPNVESEVDIDAASVHPNPKVYAGRVHAASIEGMLRQLVLTRFADFVVAEQLPATGIGVDGRAFRADRRRFSIVLLTSRPQAEVAPGADA